MAINGAFCSGGNFMLEFVDKARAVSVYRRDPLTRLRTVVATINKISLNVAEEPTAVTTAEEALELTDFVKMRREAEAIERRLVALVIAGEKIPQ